MRQVKSSTKRRKTRAELNEASWELKRKKKHRGNKSGSRNKSSTDNAKALNHEQQKDPRIGSKKPVSLFNQESQSTQKNNMLRQESKPKLSLEQQLERLENDELLNVLLDKLDSNKPISETEQHYLNEMFTKIDVLMDKLGISITDDDDENTECIMHLLKQN